MGADGGPLDGVGARNGDGEKASFDFLQAFGAELEAVAFRREHQARKRKERREEDLRKSGEALAAAAGLGAKLARSKKTSGKDAKPVEFEKLKLKTKPAAALPLFIPGSVSLLEEKDVPGKAHSVRAGKGRRLEGGQTDDSKPLGWEPGDPVKGADRLNLTGMCLSGGGVRSAAVCLGAFQALDALTGKGRSDVIDSLDYISAVSGGNYVGTSMASGMMQDGGSFPYESKTDEAETPETQHLRNYSSYLVPNGFKDYLSDIFIVFRGIAANLLMFLPFLFGLVIIRLSSVDWRCGVEVCTPDSKTAPALRGVFLEPLWLNWWPKAFAPFHYSSFLAILLMCVALYWLVAKTRTPRDRGLPLLKREERSVQLGWTIPLVLVVAFLEWQPVILDAMFRAGQGVAKGVSIGAQAAVNIGSANIGASFGLGGGGQATALAPDGVSDLLGRMFAGFGQAGYVLGPAVVAFILFAQKLLNIARATFGDATWAGYAKRMASKLLLLMLGLSVPLLLWVVFLNLTYAAIAPPPSLGGSGLSGVVAQPSSGWKTPMLSNGWLGLQASWLLLTYFAIGGIALAVASSFGPNANSLHGLYRDRLSRAFLMEREKVRRRESQSADIDNWRFTSLKPESAVGGFEASAAFAPYLVVNTAINLQGSEKLGWRGRNADVFTLGALASGSDATGYLTTTTLEKVDPRLTLATGMAISGAAFSANAGRETRPILTFSLSALNIRLGYWIKNPNRIVANPPVALREGGGGIRYFYRELLGDIKETTERIHLTDGGHIENLGLYELVKRRCRVIIAVDAEADQGMVFPSLVNAQLMMRIDHGVRIELPWPEISASCRQADAMIGTPKEDEIRAKAGPHVAVGRIVYRQESRGEGQDVHGVLIYIKSSMSGDENDVIRDYKRRYSDFPHETTLDQFFSEEQFEVYRALGFHMTRGFFTGRDDAAFWMPKDKATRDGFLTDVENALQSISIPPDNISSIMTRARERAAVLDKVGNAGTPPTNAAASVAPVTTAAIVAAPAPPAAAAPRPLKRKQPAGKRTARPQGG